MAELEDLSRQRLDFTVGPQGQAVATLTITLGDGSVHRYSAEADEQEVNERAKAIANAELREMRISGEIAGMSEDDISGIFGSIYKAAKGVYNGARKIASSKVFKMAGKGLLTVGPFLGPLAPAAMAVGGGMVVASQLSDASYAVEAKAKKVADLFGNKAKNSARKVRPPIRSGKAETGRFGSVVRWANRKRKAAIARAEGREPAPRRRRKKRPLPKKPGGRADQRRRPASKSMVDRWRARALAAEAARGRPAAASYLPRAAQPQAPQAYQPQVYRPQYHRPSPYPRVQASQPMPFFGRLPPGMRFSPGPQLPPGMRRWQ